MLPASVTDVGGDFTLRYYEFLLTRRDVVVGALATARDSLTARLVGTLAMLPSAVPGVVVGLGLLQTVVFGVDVLGWNCG